MIDTAITVIDAAKAVAGVAKWATKTAVGAAGALERAALRSERKALGAESQIVMHDISAARGASAAEQRAMSSVEHVGCGQLSTPYRNSLGGVEFAEVCFIAGTRVLTD